MLKFLKKKALATLMVFGALTQTVVGQKVSHQEEEAEIQSAPSTIQINNFTIPVAEEEEDLSLAGIAA
ncbi:MAG: hypothetical protein SPL08_02300, partial [Pseudomonadota bacterium]|nr:hypothetical protein [Pseudomonadota bacterium]